MELFPLPIFPEGPLRESVVTSVWVGVFVISFFNLRFGWTYSGLVIPGYLVPLFLTNPVTACVTVIEGMLAYGLVRFVSDYLSRFGWWCNFFGRDRFFALFVSAVLVRVLMDGWCLPALGGWLQQYWNMTFDYKGAFHSFGMIIIALIANQFWKTGFLRGLAPFATTLAVTFFIVRFVLMTVTNFNVGHMAYMYSSTAASLLASPKSYIILVVTGFVASRMNLRYGWEYNGILIPALLALQWYEPLKILSSLCEAAVVYIVSDLLLQSRLFRGTTMEGARKLLLFFNVAYAYRFLLGHLLPLISPGVVVNDYYGFAYLLSSLIALKMHSKHIVLRLARATLQTSFVAAVAANLLGLWLASLLGSLTAGNHRQQATLPPLKFSADTVEWWTAREKVRLYRKRAPESVVMPTPGELNQFQQALELIQKHVETGTEEPLVLARRHLHELRVTVELLEGSILCLREAEPARGWGLYLIDLKRPNGLVIEVPAPLEEWSVVESAVRLYRVLGGSTMMLAGGGRFANKDGSSDVLASTHTPFQVFHRVFSRRNVLQVRGYTEEAIRHLHSPAENCLYVKHELPRGLSLMDLQRQIGNFDISWRSAPLPNAQQRRTKSGFAELWLTRPSRIGLKAALANSLQLPLESAIPEDKLLLEWLIDQKRSMARAGTGRYVPARPEEMLYLDEEVLTPMLEVAKRHYRTGGLTAQGTRLVRAINVSACLLNYQVCYRHDTSQNQDFLLLTEYPQAVPRRYWGTFVLRLGKQRPYTIQVPRPLFDMNSLEYGVHLFDHLKAESLLFAGSHNEANQDQASDTLDFRNTANLFSLVNQVVMREAGDRPKMAVQCRGYAVMPGLLGGPEVLIAFQDGIRTETMLTPLGDTLVRTLTEHGLRWKFVDGSPISAGYEISGVPQAQYLGESKQKEFAILWLSPGLRDVYRPQDEAYPLQAQLKALGIPIAADDLPSFLKPWLNSGRKTHIPPALKQALERYVATMDIVSLQQTMKGWPNFRFAGLLDRNSQQLLLLISEDPGAAPAALNPRPRLAKGARGSKGELAGERESEEAREQGSQGILKDDNERILSFLASRSSWLEWTL
jgi:gamma-polyglutamate biosynthesis protein CapC